MKGELKVKAIEKGTVIDHIKAENLFKILSIIENTAAGKTRRLPP